MATTSNTLAASKAMTGRGNNGKDGNGRAAGLVATAALGLSLVVGGLLSQGRQAAPTAPQASTNPFASSAQAATMWDFREDRRAETRDLFIPGQFTYREDGRAGGAAEFVPQSVADQFTYREDRRAGYLWLGSVSITAQNCVYADAPGVPSAGCGPDFYPNQFTYREDRREP